jgi:tRNA pseudouridine65 synthase
VIALHVLAEGPGWVVVAKPARLACHRSELVQDRMTLHRMAEHQFGPPIHLIHRLDRAASGCLVLGRDPATAQRLQAAMTAPGAHKVYLAMVRGFFCWDDPVLIDKPMADDNGVERDARSVVEVIGRSHAPRCSLLRVRPETGRFHQVRRHVRDLNHPILGDRIHGDSRENVRWRDEQGLSRLALHALSIDLPMDDGTRLQVTCPPPGDLAAVWQRMPWWADAQAAEPALQLPPIVLRSPNPV